MPSRRFAWLRLPSLLAAPAVPVIRASAALTALAACSPSHAKTVGTPPPRAEFLLSSADSTFWISTTGGGGQVNVRGVPLILTRYGGRWYELYTADDDFSYDDALLLGERIYRRDLLTDDSAMVFADTTVPRVAAAYARAHPDERPLDPDEDGEANPSTSATAEVDLLDVFGPYLSYEYRVDIALPGRQPWHSVRRGVLDLRSGRESRVSDLFGSPVAEQVAAAGRRAYEATRDSVLRLSGGLSAGERRVADAIRTRPFDDRSFTLTEVNGEPAVGFGVPGRGEGAAGRLIQLDPLEADSAATPWWRDVRAGLPTTDDQDDDRWAGPGYHVVARYDTLGQTAHIALVDSANREWPVTTVLAPLRRIDWLDRPRIAPEERRALARAFDAAATYDEAARVASAAGIRSEHSISLFHLVTTRPRPRPRPRSHASDQDRPRKPARDLGADDARARQQPRARIRWCDPLDHGQGRRDRRLSAQPRQRRDGIDRPGRLSRADSRRGSGRHAGECELRGAHLDGSRSPGRS